MISFTTYLITGEIIGSGICQESTLELQGNPQKGILVMEGASDYNTQYVDNGQIINKPSKPVNGEYLFDYTNKTWVPNSSKQEAVIKMLRNDLLAKSDWTDTASAPTRLGTEIYNAWQEYRQLLRDIPQQSGYPYNVVWPTPPG